MSPESSVRRRRVKTQLLRLLEEEVLTVELVSAYGGDRELTQEERVSLESLRQRRGDAFFSDCLFALVHLYFPPPQARTLWNSIVTHKRWLSEKIGRSVTLSVAAHDYLVSVEPTLVHPIVISEPSFTLVAEVAVKDSLTHLYDHSTFFMKLREELQRCERYGLHLALLLFDLDHFKKLNDSYGHPEGDRILKTVAEILRNELRAVDIGARYGGEEFAVILPETRGPAAMCFAERLRQRIEREFQHDRGVTISLGISLYPEHGQEAHELLRAADLALYTSKHNGRNRSTLFHSRQPLEHESSP